MEPSRLLKLPPEMRNLIWEYALHEQHPVRISRSNSAEAPLLRTCKKIRNEGELIFYDTNDFDAIVTMFDWQHVAHWLRHRPPEKLFLIRSLTLKLALPGVDSTWPPLPRQPPNISISTELKYRRPPKGILIDAFENKDFGGRDTASVVHVSVNGGTDTERIYEELKPSRQNHVARLLLLFLSYGREALDDVGAETTAEGVRVERTKVDDRLEEAVRKRSR
ncbi:hypothetical protein LTR78_000145 [Recurvomyces mirabilis]|uniref:2EXR domain-containing protein n=1 Tax=Recurvomyces mirabilis TaxID=574656 RepID=A0AAE0WXD0_9PEZI|nr:hypothetical protein LTR78_000145 [Recurvomyces mirabilis]KAK5161802.1 hypothetical protein LTS14_000147 [Recurvomyces mirabilis]